MTPLATILADRGMSRAELARRVGCTRNHISMLVRGRREPGVALGQAIAWALRIQLSHLWPFRNQENEMNGNETKSSASSTIPDAEQWKRYVVVFADGSSVVVDATCGTTARDLGKDRQIKNRFISGRDMYQFGDPGCEVLRVIRLPPKPSRPSSQPEHCFT